MLLPIEREIEIRIWMADAGVREVRLSKYVPQSRGDMGI